MKSTLLIVLALLIVASMSSCGYIQQQASTSPAVSTSASGEVETNAVSDLVDITSSTTSKSSYVASAADSSKQLSTRNQTTDSSAELIKLLENIQKNAKTETPGSHMITVRLAVSLLNWGVGTEMTNKEICDTVIDWMMPKGNNESVDICNKLGAVDEAYKELLGKDAQDLLSSAGCKDAPYPWSDQPIESIETVMAAAGLR